MYYETIIKKYRENVDINNNLLNDVMYFFLLMLKILYN